MVVVLHWSAETFLSPCVLLFFPFPQRLAVLGMFLGAGGVDLKAVDVRRRAQCETGINLPVAR